MKQNQQNKKIFYKGKKFTLPYDIILLKGGEIMKTINVLNLYIDIVEDKKRLSVNFVLNKYHICKRTLRYYQAEINQFIIPRKNLQCYICKGFIFVDLRYNM